MDAKNFNNNILLDSKGENVFDNQQIMSFVKSPLNYVGGKYKLLSQLLPLFPNHIHTFVDLFCGGGNICANVHAEKIIANDHECAVVDIYKQLQVMGIDKALDYIERTIGEYGLNKTNADGYNQFRLKYNCGEKEPLDLFILICHSFNHQIRFNSKGQFNMPFGKDRSEYNKNIRNNLIQFTKAIRNIEFFAKDFREFNFNGLGTDDFVYCDPPYLITCAAYNERDGWNETDERDLYALLDKLNANGVKFAMSNVLVNKGKTNEMLKEWAKGNYHIFHLKHSYANCNYHAKDKTTESDEVLITNYINQPLSELEFDE